MSPGFFQIGFILSSSSPFFSSASALDLSMYHGFCIKLLSFSFSCLQPHHCWLSFILHEECNEISQKTRDHFFTTFFIHLISEHPGAVFFLVQRDICSTTHGFPVSPPCQHLGLAVTACINIMSFLSNQIYRIKTTTKLGNHTGLCTSLHSPHENFNPRPGEAGLRSDLDDWELD